MKTWVAYLIATLIIGLMVFGFAWCLFNLSEQTWIVILKVFAFGLGGLVLLGFIIYLISEFGDWIVDRYEDYKYNKQLEQENKSQK